MKGNTSSRRDDDDGHTIADMNLDGMPWYDPSKKDRPAWEDKRNPMSPEEKRATLVAVTAVSLLIAAVFGLVFLGVIALFDLAAYT